MSRIDERRKHAQAEPSAEYAHKRAGIIEAAARVFQRNGYERASMNDVATEAGADRASVYYYFKGKHELFHAVIIDAVQHLVDSAERIAAADVPASEKVRELVAELMRAYTDHYPYLYVYVQEDMTKLSVNDMSSKTLRQLARRFTSAVEGMMAAGIESGEFKSGLDPQLATNAVLGALNWSHRWFKPGRAAAPDEVAAVFIEIFLHGLVSAPQPGTPEVVLQRPDQPCDDGEFTVGQSRAAGDGDGQDGAATVAWMPGPVKQPAGLQFTDGRRDGLGGYPL